MFFSDIIMYKRIIIYTISLVEQTFQKKNIDSFLEFITFHYSYFYLLLKLIPQTKNKEIWSIRQLKLIRLGKSLAVFEKRYSTSSPFVNLTFFSDNRGKGQ